MGDEVGRPLVLFVCVHNAGRSQMAAALMERPSDKRYLDWDLTDPAGKTLAEVRPIRDQIGSRVTALLAEL
jgi:protein-tyrosine-phosphatase